MKGRVFEHDRFKRVIVCGCKEAGHVWVIRKHAVDGEPVLERVAVDSIGPEVTHAGKDLKRLMRKAVSFLRQISKSFASHTRANAKTNPSLSLEPTLSLFS
jgi:hypothetical protein